MKIMSTSVKLIVIKLKAIKKVFFDLLKVFCVFNGVFFQQRWVITLKYLITDKNVMYKKEIDIERVGKICGKLFMFFFLTNKYV